jgi:glycine hydroxymethyltransferase
MREIADSVGAVFMVDMAHFAGLVAGKAFSGDYDPVAHAHVVTSTTHKTLRGPRAGLVLAKAEFAEALDKGCPLTMGGPLPHVIAAKAVAFKEARRPEFQAYAANIVENCRALADSCVRNGLTVLTGGTDNHLILVNVSASAGGQGAFKVALPAALKAAITGRQAESALHECGITCNRNSLPADPNGPWYTSGLRIGTAAVTSLGMGKPEMDELGSIISLVIKNTKPAPDTKDPSKTSKAKYVIEEKAAAEARGRVKKLLDRYPVYPELDLDFLKRAFVQ